MKTFFLLKKILSVQLSLFKPMKNETNYKIEISIS